jgi:hypothetical protein
MVRIPAVAEQIPVASMKGGGPYNWLLAAASVLIVLALVECGLRISGRVPGEFRSLDGFRSVDSLIVLDNFVTDEAGIYKFGPWVSDSLQRHFESFGCGFNESWKRRRIARGDVSMDDIDRVYRGFLELRSDRPCNPFINAFSKTGTDTPTEFGDAYRSIRAKGAVKDLERAIVEMVHRPYNAEGFRSIPFSGLHSVAPRVLIIGDSFVYGMSARPYYNSFTDILLARGYMVYSAGIPGTDPAQYAAIAKKYVPLLKPDMVVVCFYPGNDLMPFPREPHPERPHEHMTNAGFFDSNPEGTYLTPDEAYRFYHELVTIPTGVPAYRFWSGTVLAGVLWNVLYRADIFSHAAIARYEAGLNQISVSPISNTMVHLNRIDSVCNAEGVSLLNVLIPDVLDCSNVVNGIVGCDTVQLDYLFGNRSYHFPWGIFKAEKDFPGGDYHFNNSGSRKFADFLDTLLRLHGLAPTDKVTFGD